ncbi:MAG: FMN-binding protein [Candidatus Zixiibacteriota bacterium]
MAKPVRKSVRRLIRRAVILASIVPVWAAGVGLAEDMPSEEEIGPVQVLQSESAALREIFPGADSIVCDTFAITPQVRDSLQSQLGRDITESEFVCFDVYRSAQRLGTAVVADERGKYRPITFMAGVDTTHHVVDVRVLIYRESRGGEVQKTRFLKQYDGKSLDDPIRINRDIINITGATISVNALNHGVRKALGVASIRDRLRSPGGAAP